MIVLAVTLAVVLVAITIVVVVFVCVRAAEQRHSPNITDIKYRHDSVDKTLPNGSAKTNGCVTRNGAGNMAASSPRTCAGPCTGVCAIPPSTVVDCRYPHAMTSTLPQVRLVNRLTFQLPAVVLRSIFYHLFKQNV